MLRNLKCIKNKVNKGCNKREVKEIIYEISKNNNRLNIINRLGNNLRQCLESEDIDKILEFNIEKINEYNIDYDDRDLKRNSLCKFNPDVCNINIKLENEKLYKLNKQIKEKISLYNEDLLVLEKLKKHYQSNNDASKDIYIKFKRDKKDNLIGLYFDIEKFVKDEMSNIYLFSKNTPDFCPSVLFLMYKRYIQHSVLVEKSYKRSRDYGYALICDFLVKDKRLGHGTFMLSNLEPILYKVNKRIRYMNRNIDNDDRIINEIVAVNGTLGPGDNTTFDDLVEFYNNNGYPTYSNGHIENKNIYKEI